MSAEDVERATFVQSADNELHTAIDQNANHHEAEVVDLLLKNSEASTILGGGVALDDKNDEGQTISSTLAKDSPVDASPEEPSVVAADEKTQADSTANVSSDATEALSQAIKLVQADKVFGDVTNQQVEEVATAITNKDAYESLHEDSIHAEKLVDATPLDEPLDTGASSETQVASQKAENDENVALEEIVVVAEKPVESSESPVALITEEEAHATAELPETKDDNEFIAYAVDEPTSSDSPAAESAPVNDLVDASSFTQDAAAAPEPAKAPAADPVEVPSSSSDAVPVVEPIVTGTDTTGLGNDLIYLNAGSEEICYPDQSTPNNEEVISKTDVDEPEQIKPIAEALESVSDLPVPVDPKADETVASQEHETLKSEEDTGSTKANGVAEPVVAEVIVEPETLEKPKVETQHTVDENVTEPVQVGEEVVPAKVELPSDEEAAPQPDVVEAKQPEPVADTSDSVFGSAPPVDAKTDEVVASQEHDLAKPEEDVVLAQAEKTVEAVVVEEIAQPLKESVPETADEPETLETKTTIGEVVPAPIKVDVTAEPANDQGVELVQPEISSEPTRSAEASGAVDSTKIEDDSQSGEFEDPDLSKVADRSEVALAQEVTEAVKVEDETEPAQAEPVVEAEPPEVSKPVAITAEEPGLAKPEPDVSEPAAAELVELKTYLPEQVEPASLQLEEAPEPAKVEEVEVAEAQVLESAQLNQVESIAVEEPKSAAEPIIEDTPVLDAKTEVDVVELTSAPEATSTVEEAVVEDVKTEEPLVTADSVSQPPAHAEPPAAAVVEDESVTEPAKEEESASEHVDVVVSGSEPTVEAVLDVRVPSPAPVIENAEVPQTSEEQIPTVDGISSTGAVPDTNNTQVVVDGEIVPVSEEIKDGDVAPQNDAELTAAVEHVILEEPAVPTETLVVGAAVEEQPEPASAEETEEKIGGPIAEPSIEIQEASVPEPEVEITSVEIPVGEAPSGVASDERVEVLHVADEQPANVKIIQDDVIASETPVVLSESGQLAVHHEDTVQTAEVDVSELPAVNELVDIHTTESEQPFEPVSEPVPAVEATLEGILAEPVATTHDTELVQEPVTEVPDAVTAHVAQDDAKETEVSGVTDANVELEVAVPSATQDSIVEESPAPEAQDGVAVEVPSVETQNAAAVIDGSNDVPSTAESTEDIAPAISITTDATDGDEVAPTTPVIVNADHPKSPWTPSYSVVTQGPGVVDDDAAELKELEQLPPADQITPVEDAPAIQAEEQNGEAVDESQLSKSSSWPVSYSVSSQGASPLHQAQDFDNAEVQHAEPLSESSAEPAEPAVNVVEPSSTSVVPVVPEEDVEAPSSQESVPEPEQEAIHLNKPVEAVAVEDKYVGNTDLLQETATQDTEELTASIPSVQVDVEFEDEQKPSEEPIPERPWTPLYSVVRQGSLSPAQSAEPLEAESKEAAPERPWTPSYSVSQQGASPQASPRVLAHVPSIQLSEEVPSIAEAASTTVEEAVSDEVVAVPSLRVEDKPVEETATATEIQEPVPERPWTPSYSVVQQGNSPHASPKALEDELNIENVDAAPARPWTPSYSVSRQGSSPLQTPASLEDVPQVAAEVPEVKELETPAVGGPIVVEQVVEEPAQLTEVVQPIEEPAPTKEIVQPEPAEEVKPSVNEDEAETEQTPAVPEVPRIDIATEPAVQEVPSTNGVEIERPKSPWTPSYSVSQQGSSPFGTPAVNAKELQDEPAVELLAAIDQTAIEEPTRTNVPTIAVQSSPEDKATASGSEAVEDRPERPWTPSYSVVTQGSASGTHTPVEQEPEAPVAANSIATEVAKEPVVHPFPSTEEAEPALKIATKPSLARLAPLNELEPIDVISPPALETLSPTSGRTRLESTTSSRFFPGGWFSNPTKSPEANRASLDHASGVFTKTPGTSAIEVPANTPIDGIDENEDKKKSRWCVIM
ncbi:unnamed protein product [Somion occarium]|uniref:Uncharacterized protein n=1 Tax=Somion occarium TaxID=3059160 RepID=A0ABP1E991_9APHY